MPATGWDFSNDCRKYLHCMDTFTLRNEQPLSFDRRATSNARAIPLQQVVGLITALAKVLLRHRHSSGNRELAIGSQAATGTAIARFWVGELNLRYATAVDPPAGWSSAFSVDPSVG